MHDTPTKPGLLGTVVARWTTTTEREALALRDVFMRDAHAAAPCRRYWAAQALGALILLASLALAFWSLWAIWTGWQRPQYLLLFGGVFALLLVVLARPGLGSVPPKSERVTPAQTPELWALIREVSEQLRAPVPAYLTVTPQFNAFMGVAGLTGRSHLMLGLPILLSLTPQERVAIIAHELAHSVNRDPLRGLVAYQALNFLWHLGSVLRPAVIFDPDMGLLSVAALPFTLLLLGLLWIPQGLAWLLLQLSGEASQRAEDRADLLAASVCGTPAALSGLDKLHLSELYSYSLHKQRLNPERPHAFAEFAHQLSVYPPDKLAALRRRLTGQLLRLDASHPPTSYRMAVVCAHPQPATVRLQPARAQNIEAELAPLIGPVQREAFSWQAWG